VREVGACKWEVGGWVGGWVAGAAGGGARPGAELEEAERRGVDYVGRLLCRHALLAQPPESSPSSPLSLSRLFFFLFLSRPRR
jgi:hypothetical protein